MGKKKAQAPTLSTYQIHVVCRVSISSDAPVATAARPKATGRKSTFRKHAVHHADLDGPHPAA